MSLKVMKIQKHNTHCMPPGTFTSYSSPYIPLSHCRKNLIPLHRLPLYHFVTADLPSSTKSPELDDANAITALQADYQSTGRDSSGGSAVGVQVMGRYLAYLIAVGFLPKPPMRKEGKSSKSEREETIELEAFVLGEGQKEALGKVGGRGGMV